MEHIEQIEMIVIGGRVHAYFRTKLETTLPRAFGRAYGHLTDASLQRLVNTMNSSMCDLKIKKDGRFISMVATRRVPNMARYTVQEWKDLMSEVERAEEDERLPW